MAEKYFMHIKSWQEGTEGLSLELEALYLRLINLMYQQDGFLPDDDDLISHKVFLSKRKYKTLKTQLLKTRKIYIGNGLLLNIKTLKELDYINEKSAKNSTAAKIKAAKYQTKLLEKTPKSLENNDQSPANAEQTLSEPSCESSAIQGGRREERTPKPPREPR
ncbi:MAG: DUF1376 domain-containing protein [Emcibacter sp.]|nr:DUF1376 domain-containing protein [Emcibacter sp.]